MEDSNMFHYKFSPWTVAGNSRVVASEDMWSLPLKWEKAAQDSYDKWHAHHMDECPPPERTRVFCDVDVFGDWPGPMVDANGEEIGNYENDGPLEIQDVRRRLFELIDDTPNLDWILPTRQPENVASMISECNLGLGEFGVSSLDEDMPNLWIGAWIENQSAADEKIPKLLKISAAVRFLLCDPLIEPLDLSEWMYTVRVEHNGDGDTREVFCRPDIHLVTVGGESGPCARPMHPDWVRGLRDQCTAAGVPFYFECWGDWVGGEDFFSESDDECGPPGLYAQLCNGITVHESKISDEDWHNWNDDSTNCVNDPVSVRVGKKLAGRMLDGRTWDEFPKQK